MYLYTKQLLQLITNPSPTLLGCCYKWIGPKTKASYSGERFYVQGNFWRWLCKRNLNTADQHHGHKRGVRGASSCPGCHIACPWAALPLAWPVKDKRGIYCWRRDQDFQGKEAALALFAP